VEITDAQEAQAKRAVLAWLRLVDRCDYGAAHSTAAAFFQSQITAAELGASLAEARTTYGAVTERTFRSMAHHRTLPSVPPGDYLVMQVVSQSEGLVETVTPVFEAGQWRVCGYFIKKG